MIAAPTRGSLRWAILAAVAAEPGELAVKRLRVDGTTVLGGLADALRERGEGILLAGAALGVECKRLADRGLLARRAVRVLARPAHLGGHGPLVGRLFDALADAAEGLPLEELARQVGQRRARGQPTGYLQRELNRLYGFGYLSPPAALWCTPAGFTLISE